MRSRGMLPAIGTVRLSTLGNGSITQFPILTMPNDVWSLNRLDPTTSHDILRFWPVLLGQTLQFAVECFLGIQLWYPPSDGYKLVYKP